MGVAELQRAGSAVFFLRVPSLLAQKSPKMERPLPTRRRLIGSGTVTIVSPLLGAVVKLPGFADGMGPELRAFRTPPAPSHPDGEEGPRSRELAKSPPAPLTGSSIGIGDEVDHVRVNGVGPISGIGDNAATKATSPLEPWRSGSPAPTPECPPRGWLVGEACETGADFWPSTERSRIGADAVPPIITRQNADIQATLNTFILEAQTVVIRAFL
jgi:hypothetical protein